MTIREAIRQSNNVRAPGRAIAHERNEIVRLARDPKVVGIHCYSVEADILKVSASTLQVIPTDLPLTPPFESAFFEFSYGAVLVNRYGDPEIGKSELISVEKHFHVFRNEADRWLVLLVPLMPLSEKPTREVGILSFRCFLFLGADGRPNSAGLCGDSRLLDEMPSAIHIANEMVAIASHALARLNCKNVTLKPKSGLQSEKRPAWLKVPMSVWHEIVVNDSPVTRKSRAEASLGCSERRFQWIRGHYADYSKGPGLFGNPKLKGVYWIPEHRIGNEENGTVVSTYSC